MEIKSALTKAVAPREGCTYCHVVNDLASDEKRPKVDARNLLHFIADDGSELEVKTTSVATGQIIEGLSLAAAAKTAVAETYLNTGRTPKNRSDAGMSAHPRDTQGRYVSSLEIRQGTIIITYGNNADSALRGSRLALQPLVSADDSVSWICGKATAPRNFFPMRDSVSAVEVTTISDSALPDECR